MDVIEKELRYNNNMKIKAEDKYIADKISEKAYEDAILRYDKEITRITVEKSNMKKIIKDLPSIENVVKRLRKIDTSKITKKLLNLILDRPIQISDKEKSIEINYTFSPNKQD